MSRKGQKLRHDNQEAKQYQFKKMIAINVPISKCNLRCHYCYLTQLNEWGEGDPVLKYSPEYIGQALSSRRLGEVCLINITGKGETLIPPEMPQIIWELLNQGHFLEIVTNGTLTQRFEELAQLPHEFLERLELKFSFHYLELKERELIDVFFDNVIRMRDAGASVTVELMPNDEIVDEIPVIKELCMDRMGALCHLTIGRDDRHGKKVLTQMPLEKYIEVWSQFDSPMFQFKLEMLNQKRTEFCYAGMWSLYVNLYTGEARQCYGCYCNQNIYKNLDKPIVFRPIGRKCKQPYCYNAHAFLTLGMIPELETPSYLEMRDRTDSSGKHWFSDAGVEAFQKKLGETNPKYGAGEMIKYRISAPVHCIKILQMNYKKGISSIKRRLMT
ncbi:MAG: radical SAM protein [Lachnospiraceae bacterium]|nr:radical SAM protein [Lachnospiraceae bacterium]